MGVCFCLVVKDGDWHETWRDAYLKEQMAIPAAAPPVDPVKPQRRASIALPTHLSQVCLPLHPYTVHHR